MKAKDIRNLDLNDIKSKLKELCDNYSELKFKHSISSIENPLKLRFMRRQIAVFNTVLREKEI